MSKRMNKLAAKHVNQAAGQHGSGVKDYSAEIERQKKAKRASDFRVLVNGDMPTFQQLKDTGHVTTLSWELRAHMQWLLRGRTDGVDRPPSIVDRITAALLLTTTLAPFVQAFLRHVHNPSSRKDVTHTHMFQDLVGDMQEAIESGEIL